jgi:hypothetical protein
VSPSEPQGPSAPTAQPLGLPPEAQAELGHSPPLAWARAGSAKAEDLSLPALLRHALRPWDGRFEAYRWPSYGPSPALVPLSAALVAAHGAPFLASCALGAAFLLLLGGRCGLGPQLAWPTPPQALAFLSGACSLALLVALESVLYAHHMHELAKDNTEVEDGRELLAQGLCLGGKALLGAAPSSGSLPRAVFNWREGARTPLSSVAKAVGMAIALPWLDQALGGLPLAALGALLLALAWRLTPSLETRLAAWLWPLATAAACLALGLAWGLLGAWALCFLWEGRRASSQA